MSRIFPGLKVRHVGQGRAYVNPLSNMLIGATGVVESPWKRPGWWNVVLDTGSYDLCAHESTLEPILPEGHRAGDYSLSELMDRCKHGEGVPA
jgi:hypothetical protein